jgi:hypothetical protein
MNEYVSSDFAVAASAKTKEPLIPQGNNVASFHKKLISGILFPTISFIVYHLPFYIVDTFKNKSSVANHD